MTPAERRLWQALERQASAIAPDLRAAVLALWRSAGRGVSDAALLRLIERGDVAGLVEAVLADMSTDAATAPLREAIRTGYARSARAGIRALPLPKAQLVGVAFDFLNPRIIAAVRTLETRALTAIGDATAGTVRQVVERGLTDGQNPRALIRDLRDRLALAPNQEAAVANFRAALEAGRFGKARGYALRDRRFDALLRRAEGLTPAQVERMVAAYTARMRAFHAETLARTTALDAARAGRAASWEAAIAENGIPRSRVTKRWVATLDARTRPEHAAMHGVTVPLDGLFAVDGGVSIPGENTYNCRCILSYRIQPA